MAFEHPSSVRRWLLQLAVFALAALTWLHAPASAQDKAGAAPLKIGIIGSGNIGSVVGELWVKAGHEVLFSSRNPEQLKEMAAALGTRARVGTVGEAAAFGPVVFLAVPYGALPQIGRDHAKALAGKVLIDASNPLARRDGAVAEEAMANGIGVTSVKYLGGVRYVRAFNPVPSGDLRRQAHRSGTLIGIPVAGDDAGAVAMASRLVRDAGFEPVAVPLAQAQDFAPGTPLFDRATPVDELRKRLGGTR
jgi:predicted dinucleotide-binding enzyme